MAKVPRTELLAQIERLLRESPVVALLGPRQSGKTTLAREIASKARVEAFDLEDPRDLRALEHPMTALEVLRGLVVLDEIQRAPEIFPVLRVLADRKPRPARFLVLGSASPELLQQSSESLAGRIRFVELHGFSLAEVGAENLRRRLLRGGFPPAYLARSDAASFGWREDFLRTFVERDVPALGARIQNPANLRRLLTMLAHRHGQLWNGAALAASLGEAYLTVKRHLDLLTAALVVRQLPPFAANTEKRVVKSPKVYLRDSGLVHALLGVRTSRELSGHPVLGASFEGLVLEEILVHVAPRFVSFWGTHNGAEIDFVVETAKGPIGVEAKWSDAPTMTKSMHIALEDLGLSRIYVAYPGAKRFRIHERVEVVPIGEIATIFAR